MELQMGIEFNVSGIYSVVELRTGWAAGFYIRDQVRILQPTWLESVPSRLGRLMVLRPL